jgi:hypothetical protein
MVPPAHVIQPDDQPDDPTGTYDFLVNIKASLPDI